MYGVFLLDPATPGERTEQDAGVDGTSVGNASAVFTVLPLINIEFARPNLAPPPLRVPNRAPRAAARTGLSPFVADAILTGARSRRMT